MYRYPEQYDVLVLGGGHAGVEAALAASRIGAKTLLLNINNDTIGQMSCNPAIGGLAKGHLAREVDALGGEMGINTEMSAIHARILNSAKGPAVRAPRAQCDKKAYQFRLKWTCERQPNLDLLQDRAIALLFAKGRVTGVRSALNIEYSAKTVVVTTGTFLKALMHTGSNQQTGGRAGESSVSEFSASLNEIGLRLGRLKTGTPPRLLKRTLDLDLLEPQEGETPVPAFSYWRDELFHVEHQEYPTGSVLEQLGVQLPCHISHTNDRTAAIIRENLHLSPMYSGVIQSTGPRYCPSIEDKIVRFADKPSHQVFLEPEGIHTDEYYINGFSTSLPFPVQREAIRTIPGCERAEIYRPAYAVEYDFVFPEQLYPTLETKTCENLFLAGQINGTSGYEEAAAQGIMAGINAAQRAQSKEPIILRRDQAYIGVLIDDLVTKGTKEPYRMFTSRAEYRLLLRQDNADLRLGEIGHTAGLLSHDRITKTRSKATAIQNEIIRLQNLREGEHTLERILRRPEVSYHDLPSANTELEQAVIEQVEIEVKYAGYIERQNAEVEKTKSLERKQLPDWIDFSSLPGLRNEARQKLADTRPKTIGQASRISGISPADIAVVLVAMKKGPVDQSEEAASVSED